MKEDNTTLLTGTIRINDIPFLNDYEKLKKRLSIRLNNLERIHEKPQDTVYEPFLDFAISCHIDVSDVVGVHATCTVKKSMMKFIGVEKKRVFADALENGAKTRPPLTMPIENYMEHLGFMGIGVEQEHQLMIATTKEFLYGASVVLYPGFLQKISGGKQLFLIPSSVHEWLYIEDLGRFTKEELTDLLRSVNREVVSEEEVLSNWLYYYDGRKDEIQRA